jgi:ABC-2 type transport system ATP-binding protein
VILTSHYMEDVAALCPRIIVIDHGHIIWDGALADLVQKLQPEKRVTLRLAEPRSAEEIALPPARLVSLNGTEARLSVAKSDLQRVVAALLGKLPVVDLSVEDAPLEEVLAQLFTEAGP